MCLKLLSFYHALSISQAINLRDYENRRKSLCGKGLRLCGGRRFVVKSNPARTYVDAGLGTPPQGYMTASQNARIFAISSGGKESPSLVNLRVCFGVDMVSLSC